MPKLDFGIALCVLAIVCVGYGLLVFVFLPRAQLAKYPSAAGKYLNHELSAERFQDFSPLYLEVHILARKITSKPEALLAGVQVFLSGISAALLFLLLLRFCGRIPAIAGVAAFVLDRGMIEYAQVQEPETFLIVAVLSFAYVVTSPKSNRFRGPLFAGIFLALSVVARPVFLPVIVLMPFYFRSRPDFVNCWRRAACLLAFPVLLAAGGLCAWNSLALGYFSPSVMNPGTVFYEGNNPNSWGFSSVYPALVDEVAKLHPEDSDYQHELYREFARKITGRQLTIPQVNRYWSGLAIQYLMDHPGHALRLYCTRFFHIFHRFQWHDVASAYWNEQWLASRVPTVPFSIISALALAGILTQVRNWRGLMPMYGLLLVQVLSMTVIYVSARQRVSIEWIFYFFASAAVRDLVRSSRPRTLAWSIALVPLVWVLHAHTDLMREEDHLWRGIRLSNSYLSDSYRARAEDRLPDASRASAASLALAPFFQDSRRPANLHFSPGYAAAAADLVLPRDPSGVFDAAVLDQESGRSVEATKMLEQTVFEGRRFKRDQYQSSEPLYYLARVALAENDQERAIDCLLQAEERSPGDPSVLALLSVLDGEERFSQMLSRYFDEIDSQFYIGRAALMAGRPELAVRCLTYVTGKLPEFRRARIYLAVALGRAGRVEDGVELYRQVMKQKPDPVMLEEGVLDLFGRYVAQKDRGAFDLYTWGVVLRQYGHYKEALVVQQKAASLNSSSAIQKEMDALRKAIQAFSIHEPDRNRTE